MALSANVIRQSHGDPASMQAQVANTAVLYQGAYVAGGSESHGTAASRGRIFPWTGAAGQIPLGFSLSGAITGDTSATPPTAARVGTGPSIVEFCPVTGLAGTVVDNFKKVYATADGTFTLTRPAAPNDFPVGFTRQFRTSALCDVYFFSAAELFVLMSMGGDTFLWTLGSISASAATGNALTGIVAPCHGRFGMVAADVFAICTRDPTDADVSLAVNLEIGGTNVTGGVITCAFNDTEGLKKDGTAVTAANEFHRGDLIDVEVVTNPAATAADPGEWVVYAVCERLLGL